MSYSFVGDTLAIINLAYKLYSRVIIVARGAPEQFDDLLQDLQTMKVILYQIGDRVNHDRDPAQRSPVDKILGRCLNTLWGLGNLMSKYENLCKNLWWFY